LIEKNEKGSKRKRLPKRRRTYGGDTSLANDFFRLGKKQKELKGGRRE